VAVSPFIDVMAGCRIMGALKAWHLTVLLLCVVIALGIAGVAALIARRK
jgi:hypothetical protein